MKQPVCNEAYRLLAFYNSFILCYTVLYNFFALVFALIRVHKH